MTDEKRGTVSEGIRTGVGILAAFRDAVEETLQEVMDRGDLSPERARATMRDAAQRLTMSLEEARERLDLVPRRELELLREEVEELRARVDRLEAGGAAAEGSQSPSEPIPVD